jgi:uncharacterized Zn finger protein
MSFYNYGGFPAYVSVAQRKAKAEKAAAAAKKKGAIYAPIAAFKGAPGKTFWGKAWCTNLASYSDYENRLPRGASYVRNGAVIDLQIDGGSINARVVGSSIYSVEIKVAPVNAMQWKAISRDCSGSIDSLVELLQGKLSTAVMQRICAKQTGLFPDPRELRLACSCPDGANMCKHVAAVLYGVGMRLDVKPELLFGLRGVDAKDLVGQASVSIGTAKTIAATKVLDTNLMSDLFGLEMATSTVVDAPTSTAATPKVMGKTNAVVAENLTKPAAVKKGVTPKKGANIATVTVVAKPKTSKAKPPAVKVKSITVKTKMVVVHKAIAGTIAKVMNKVGASKPAAKIKQLR